MDTTTPPLFLALTPEIWFNLCLVTRMEQRDQELLVWLQGEPSPHRFVGREQQTLRAYLERHAIQA